MVFCFCNQHPRLLEYAALVAEYEICLNKNQKIFMSHDLIPCFLRSDASVRMNNWIILALFFHPIRIGSFLLSPRFHGTSRLCLLRRRGS